MACSIDVLQHDASPPPPAYHDGGAIERPPSYRHGHLVRHHPYGRHTHNLLQRLLLTPYAYEDYEPTSLGNDAVVSGELPSYESAEALIVLARLGYTLELRIVPRQAPSSAAANIRCVLERWNLKLGLCLVMLLKLTRFQNTSSPASSTSARPVSRDASSSLHDAQSCSPPEYRPIVSTSRALKRKRDEFEGQGDPE